MTYYKRKVAPASGKALPRQRRSTRAHDTRGVPCSSLEARQRQGAGVGVDRVGGRASDCFNLLSQNFYKLDTLMATTGRNIVVALPYAKRVTSGMTCLRTKWVMDLFKSPRQKLDPLDMEILERAFT